MSTVLMKSKNQCWGDYFGYPKCCIRSFHDMLKSGYQHKDLSHERKIVTTNGFVPCQNCAERIVRGEITIYELILPTRLSPKTFRF
jgi:hypothetical protein